MPRLSIRQKSLLVFILISIVPMLLINFYWVHASKASMHQLAASGQNITTAGAAAQAHSSDVAIVILWISGVIVVALSILFSRWLTAPILKLVEGVNRVGTGDLEYRLPVDSDDEVGRLAKSFNSVAASVEQLVKNVEASRSNLDVVLNSIGEGVVAVDKSEKIIVSNLMAAKLVGTTPNQIVSEKLSDVFRWTQNDKPLLIDYSQTNSTYTQLQLLSPSAQIHYLDLVVAQISDDPSGIRAIITIHDETKNRELEAMKVDFVSMAAHELRTPLTAVRGYIELLKDVSTTDMTQQQKNYLDRVRASASQLAGLINNLLNVARIERGALNFHMSQLNWLELVRNIVQDQGFAAKQKDIVLRLDAPDEEMAVLGDALALTEVLNNLISNAIHYSPRGSTVSVKVQPLQDGILTSVTDNGIGIPAEAQAHLFTKFFRVHGGLEMGSGGTGLGLYISKSIVEQHKGAIWIKSALNEGSTFYFSLPYFDKKRYDVATSGQQNLNKNHGWVTKNIAR